MNKKRELIDDILDPNFNFEDDNEIEEYVLTKCLKCGFEEPVPSFIYDEFGRKKFHKELRKKVITLNCQRCDTEKFIPKKYFKD